MIAETKREIIEKKAEDIQQEKVRKIKRVVRLQYETQKDRTLRRRMIQSKSACQKLSNNTEW